LTMRMMYQRKREHTQSPLYVRLILVCVHSRAVQLTCHALIEGSTLLQRLVVCIEADDIVGQAASVGADGFARRPGNRLKGGGNTNEEDKQADQDGVEGHMRSGRIAVMPAGHSMPSTVRAASYETGAGAQRQRKVWIWR